MSSLPSLPVEHAWLENQLGISHFFFVLLTVENGSILVVVPAISENKNFVAPPGRPGGPFFRLA